MFAVHALRSPARLAAGFLLVVAAIGVAPEYADAATALTIRIGSALSPATATVVPGARITWINDDGDDHRVRSRSGPVEFDSGNIEPGESWSVVLATAGTYPYLDDRDREAPAYHGTIVVAAPTDTTGGGGGTAGGGASGGASSGGSSTAPPASAAVAIGDRVFRPATVTIAAGGTVTWRNADDRAHTATGRGGSFDTGTLAPGASSRERFPTAGTFAYLCAIHPDMQGTVRVVAAGAASAPPPAAPKATPAPTASVGTGTSTPGAGAATVETLRIVDFAFVPAASTVAAGTTIRWTNGGLAPHTVTAADGGFDSGILDAGEIWSRTFDRPGTWRLVCAVHPEMAGVLRVTAAIQPPAASATPAAQPASGQTIAGPVGSESPGSPGDEPGDDSNAAAGRTPIDVTAALRATLAIAVVAVAVLWFGRLIGGFARP